VSVAKSPYLVDIGKIRIQKLHEKLWMVSMRRSSVIRDIDAIDENTRPA
jgi:hypothetical protein